MQPSDYYSLVVKPTADDFVNDNNSPRKAVLAVIVVHHFPEHIFASRYNDVLDAEDAVKKYRVRYADKAWFKILDEVANAAKHGRRRNKYDLSELWDTYPAMAGIAMTGATFVGDFKGGVAAPLTLQKDEPLVKLDQAVLSALGQYEADFEELRVISPIT